MKRLYSPILESDSEDDDGEEVLKKKVVKYSKILDEEDDFWPEENFPSQE